MNTIFRTAVAGDEGLVLDFIQQLALYENMLDDVVATAESLGHWLFERQAAEVVFLMEDGKEVGFALYFHNFSTFLGKGGIYLEDLFVLPTCRGKGYGKALLRYLAQLAKERDCGRLEWCCLNWNQPSIDFYLSLNAVPMKEWSTYRLTGEALEQLSNG